MINACHVKLKIGIELYRTTKHENAIVFIYAQVSSKQERRKDQEAQSHRASCGI